MSHSTKSEQKKLMTKYILLIIVFLICFGFIVSARTQAHFQARENSIEIFEGWEKVHQKVIEWWKGKILPKIKAWFQKEMVIIKDELQKEKQEILEDLKKNFSQLWHWLKDLF